jgi:hypothetical protein
VRAHFRGSRPAAAAMVRTRAIVSRTRVVLRRQVGQGENWREGNQQGR